MLDTNKTANYRSVPDAIRYVRQTTNILNLSDETIIKSLDTGAMVTVIGYTTDSLYAIILLDGIERRTDNRKLSKDRIYPWENFFGGPDLQRFGQHNYTSVIENLQNTLIALGYLSPDIKKGTFGPATEEDVQAFQEKNNLDADEIVGDNTKRKLFELYNNLP